MPTKNRTAGSEALLTTLSGAQRRALSERLARNSVREGECRLWTGHASGGYGQVGLQVASRRATLRAHRVAYWLAHGPIPPGLVLDHLCRTPACINPAHLEPVSRRENTLRGVSPPATQAAQTHCKRGHPFSAENTLLDNRGHRYCIACRRALRRADAQERSPLASETAGEREP